VSALAHGARAALASWDRFWFAPQSTSMLAVVRIAFGLLVWNRKLRPWVLLAGVGLHLAIDLTIRVGFFSYAILLLYLAFIPPEVMDRWLVALRPRLSHLRHRARALRPARAS